MRIWPLDSATCIGSKFGHQLTPLALLPKLATSNTCIATLPSIALSARVTSVKSTQGLVLTQSVTDGPQVYLGPIKTDEMVEEGVP